MKLHHKLIVGIAVLVVLIGLAAGTARAFDTNSVPNCALWLKADAGAQTDGNGYVTNWVDQSASAANAAQTAAGLAPLYVHNREQRYVVALLWERTFLSRHLSDRTDR